MRTSPASFSQVSVTSGAAPELPKLATERGPAIAQLQVPGVIGMSRQPTAGRTGGGNGVARATGGGEGGGAGAGALLHAPTSKLPSAAVASTKFRNGR